MELDQVWHGKFKASSDFSVFNKNWKHYTKQQIYKQ